MERYKVSGEDLRNFYNGSTTTLDQVFKDIEGDLRAENQVVCRFIVNGMELDEAQEERFKEVPLSDIETLEYMAENSKDLIGLVMKGWIEALPELIKSTEDLSQRIRAQGFSGLMKSIHDLVHNCEFLVDSVLSLKGMVGQQRMNDAQADWSLSEMASKKTLEEALKALENKDFVLLADVLEYDLNNALQMWLDNLKSLERSLHGGNVEENSESVTQSSGSHPVGRSRVAN